MPRIRMKINPAKELFRSISVTSVPSAPAEAAVLDAGHDLDVIGDAEYPRNVYGDHRGGVTAVGGLLAARQVGDPILHTHDHHVRIHARIVFQRLPDPLP